MSYLIAIFNAVSSLPAKESTQTRTDRKTESVSKQARQEKNADRYADMFLRMIPGIERRQMYWIRKLSQNNYRISR